MTKELYKKYRPRKLEQILGNKETVKTLANMLERGTVPHTLLIQGESGVGKELVAKTTHERSNRSKRNFVAVDCCTLPEKLFESELFGHERGAFTGADRQKKGLIEGAEGGTLFLDEIGELELALQAKLLRVIETGIFHRVRLCRVSPDSLNPELPNTRCSAEPGNYPPGWR